MFDTLLMVLIFAVTLVIAKMLLGTASAEPMVATCFAGQTTAYCYSYNEVWDFVDEANDQGFDCTVRFANGGTETWLTPAAR